MAKTDTQAEAIAKNVETPVVHTPPTLDFHPADHTHMSFYTGGGGEIRCAAELQVRFTGGDGKVTQVPSVKAQDFPMEDALPADLLAAAQLIQLYLHNYAVEQANS